MIQGNAQMTFLDWEVNKHEETGEGVRVDIADRDGDGEYCYLVLHLRPEEAHLLPVGSKVRVRIDSLPA